MRDVPVHGRHAGADRVRLADEHTGVASLIDRVAAGSVQEDVARAGRADDCTIPDRRFRVAAIDRSSSESRSSFRLVRSA
jgi:hypothetical protein